MVRLACHDNTKEPDPMEQTKRNGRQCAPRHLVDVLGGRISAAGLGKMTPIHNDHNEIVGLHFQDHNPMWATAVWLDLNDLFVVERQKRDDIVGRLSGLYFDQVAEQAYKASCFLDTAFGGGDLHHLGHWAEGDALLRAAKETA